MHAVHVVKRYGPVGGMERYVWELTHALAKQGCKITILCEKAYQQPDSKIDVIELGLTRPKPRWLSMLRFSRRVTRVARQQGWKQQPNTVIHSHERTGVHDFTTFHGPPMAPIKRRKLWWLSPRLITWLWLEKRELLGPGVTVLANSLQIQNELQREYSGIQFGPIAWPAVSGPMPTCPNPKSDVVFIGHEYHRKGLDRVIEAMEIARKQRASTLSVVGAKQDAGLEKLLAGREWIHNQPWVEELNPSEWGRVLVHPARSEPYGMVVAEALASGIPAVVTANCGVVGHLASIYCVSPESPPLRLSHEILSALDGGASSSGDQFTWLDLAEIHNELYQN